MRILAGLPEDARSPEDDDLIRGEAAAQHWVSQKVAVLALAGRAEPQDVPVLVDAAANAALRRDDRDTVLRAACSVGGAAVARALLDNEDPQTSSVGAEHLAADATTDDETLNVLLHHKDAAVRRPAIDAALIRYDRDRLARVLDEYPRAPGGYFYDVMAAVDWHLYTQPSA